MKQKTEFNIDCTGETFATIVTNNQSDEEIYGSLLVSIHAPTWGATYKSMYFHMLSIFQSTLPHGERQQKCTTYVLFPANVCAFCKILFFYFNYFSIIEIQFTFQILFFRTIRCEPPGVFQQLPLRTQRISTPSGS